MARKPLYSRVPKIWQRLDQYGYLEAFLSVLDNGFDKSHDLISGLLDLHSVDRIPDKFLMFLASLVGHVWRDDKSIQFNRQRIRDAIHRHSYKGTQDRLSDTIEDNQGQSSSVTDMASKLLILSRQGRLSCNDSYLTNADPYHEGVFNLSSDKWLQQQSFLQDFAETKPAAEKWYIHIGSPFTGVFEDVAGLQRITERQISDRLGTLGYSILSQDLFCSWLPSYSTPVLSIVHQKGFITGDKLTFDSNLGMYHTNIPFTSPIDADAAIIQEGVQKTSTAI